MADAEIRNKLVLKDIGNPKGILSPDFKGEKFVLGMLIGIATGVQRRANKTDPTKMDEALIGTFEGRPADAKGTVIQSGKCYLPEGMFNMIATKLEGENAADSVQFGIEVAVIKATNPAGYTWTFTPKVKVSEADPLAGLRDQLKLPAK